MSASAPLDVRHARRASSVIPVVTAAAPEDAVVCQADGPVLVVTLNRPRVRNAIDSALSLGVVAALAWLDGDHDLRVGVLTGAGGTFCAGMDLKAFARDGLPAKVDSLFRHRCRKPLVAAVEGVALGGGLELALVADLLVAADDARFGSPEVRFGLFPGGGALLRLPRLLPQSVVTEIALTGEPVSATVALQHGLVVRLTEPAGSAAAMVLARAIAANAPLGVDAAKQLLRMAPGHSEDELWPEQVKLVDQVFTSEDAHEGATPFAEKRPPALEGSLSRRLARSPTGRRQVPPPVRPTPITDRSRGPSASTHAPTTASSSSSWPSVT